MVSLAQYYILIFQFNRYTVCSAKSCNVDKRYKLISVFREYNGIYRIFKIYVKQALSLLLPNPTNIFSYFKVMKN